MPGSFHQDLLPQGIDKCLIGVMIIPTEVTFIGYWIIVAYGRHRVMSKDYYKLY